MTRTASLLLLLLLAFGRGAPDARADEPEAVVVAVFDPQLRGIKLSPLVVASLGDYLAAALVGSGSQVVPRDQLKQRLTEQKKRSYRLCYSQTCQIAIGKELAATKSLASRVMRIGKRCVFTASLYDLKKAVAEKAATAEGPCSEDALLGAVKSAAAKLSGKQVPKPLPAEADDGTTRAPGGNTSPAVPASTTPATGPADAKVRIEDFTDYQCPFCAKSRQTLSEVLKSLPGGNKIRYIHRDYPLDSSCNPRVHSPFHQMACQAAYASRCAAEQGRFSELDALLVQEGSALDEQRLRAAITKSGVDEQKLDRCMQSPQTRQAILDDIMLGVVRGVVGTPTLFVNGEKVSGARPAEFWEQKLRGLVK